MTEKWQLVRIKKDLADTLDRHLPGIPRWKQFGEVYEHSLFHLDAQLFGMPKHRKPMGRNKRGELSNVLMMGVIVFAIAVVIIICAYVWGQVNTKWQEASVPQESKDIVAKVTGMYPTYFDKFVLFLMVGLFLATLVMSFIIVMHPALAILYGFGLIIVTLVMAILSNVYQDLTATQALTLTASQFPLTGAVLGWLPVIIFAFGIGCGTVMFKLRSVIMT